ncbi:MAG: desulfoferrodoxin family protein [Deltaproteobacteria bacterium]
MKRRRQCWIGIVSLICFLLSAPMAWANKASVEIEAPNQAPKGSEVVIKLHVKHSADNFFHHVDWVVAKVNGKEIDRWEYSAFDLPKAADFTKEIKLTADKDLEIEAQANCNIHGSAGVSKHIIFVK